MTTSTQDLSKYTKQQQQAITDSGKNLLVSASAGTGKTTVMIERIANLICSGAKVSQLVVVTFTKLAATEMKNRLALKLADKQEDAHVAEQIEQLDTACISTIHSFCSDLLRNYFYVVDIDPSFTILDEITCNSLKKNALDDVIKQYFEDADVEFKKVYKIFCTHRQDTNFKKTILELYEFARNLVSFGDWYNQKRESFCAYSENNPIAQVLLDDVRENLQYYCAVFQNLISRAQAENVTMFEEIFDANLKLLQTIRVDSLQNAYADIIKLYSGKLLQDMPTKRTKEVKELVASPFVDKIHADGKKIYQKITEDLFVKVANLTRGMTVDELWQEMSQSLTVTDKLVEVLQKFDHAFYLQKKQRGGVDFSDLEHLTLKLLADEEALASIREKYKHIFVDEYQDTNPVQEAIVSALNTKDNLFMVGDVKQSIYGFRGCEPNLFVAKYDHYKATKQGTVIELNDNFRTNNQILQFVNLVFNQIMTTDFGKVDYKQNAQLVGSKPTALTCPSVKIDFLVAQKQAAEEITKVYDITAENEETEDSAQAQLIAQKIKQYLGMSYVKKIEETPNGTVKEMGVIGYSDIVILMRSRGAKMTSIYNELVKQNVPVIANFKIDDLASKEVRDIVTLLRAVDNPYNSIYLTGTCLSVFGKFTEDELCTVRLDCGDRMEMYDRLTAYKERHSNDVISNKIGDLMSFLAQLRFFAASATVGEVVLKILQDTDYSLHVQGLPNGATRLEKLYNFVNNVSNASYATSIDKFLDYVDEVDEPKTEQSLGSSDAVQIMTMHASKGLEFPIVILAGLETEFNFDYPNVERNVDIGLASRCYNFSNMRMAETLGKKACTIVNKNKQKEEEMRILYVAMTRAKYVLHLVGNTTQSELEALVKPAKSANSHLDWLMIALKGAFGDAMQIPSSQELSVDIIEKLEDNKQTQANVDILCPQLDESALPSVLENIQYKYPFADQAEMPQKVVSSQLDKQYIDISEFYEKTLDEEVELQLDALQNQADGGAAAKSKKDLSLQGQQEQLKKQAKTAIGTAYHKLLEVCSCQNTIDQIKAVLDALVANGKIVAEVAEQLDLSIVHNALNNPQLKSIMSQGQVYHELPFMVMLPYDQISQDKRFTDDVILQGVIDLLVIDGDSATVVDFKYTSHSDKLHVYKPQLNSYKIAVQTICNVQNVKTCILSIADNKLVEI